MGVVESPMTIEKVSFYSGDVQLVGSLAIPSNLGSPGPAVVICSALGATRQSYSDLMWSLVDSGFVTLCFDYRGHGESMGNFDFEKAYHEDTPAAISFVEKQDFVDSGKIGLFGHSLGTNVAIWNAAQDQRIKVIALWGVGSRVTDFYEKNSIDYLAMVMPNVRGVSELIQRYKMMPRADFLELVSRYNAVDNIGRIMPRPVLIVQGDSDAFCSVTDACELRDRAVAYTTLIVIQGGDHFFSATRSTAIERTVHWLKEKLV